MNVTWRGKTYVGTLLDCTRHDWAPPRFCDSPTSDLDARTPKGRGKRGRAAASATPGNDLSNFTETRSSVHSKLRNGGAKGRRGAQGSPAASPSPAAFVPPRPDPAAKRKSRGPEEEEKNKRRAPPPTPPSGSPPASPVLLECPEPNCSKKYKHINGLKYHQSHAHGSADDDDTKEAITSMSENDESNIETPSPVTPVKSPADKPEGTPGRATSPQATALPPETPPPPRVPSPSVEPTTTSVLSEKGIVKPGVLRFGQDDLPAPAATAPPPRPVLSVQPTNPPQSPSPHPSQSPRPVPSPHSCVNIPQPLNIPQPPQPTQLQHPSQNPLLQTQQTLTGQPQLQPSQQLSNSQQQQQQQQSQQQQQQQALSTQKQMTQVSEPMATMQGMPSIQNIHKVPQSSTQQTGSTIHGPGAPVQTQVMPPTQMQPQTSGSGAQVQMPQVSASCQNVVGGIQQGSMTFHQADSDQDSVSGILASAAQSADAALLESLAEVTQSSDDHHALEDNESMSGTSAVAIDNKIEQAMDLVKSHLMFAVREEVEVLKEKIAELMDRINLLEAENSLLKAHATTETLAQLSSQSTTKLPQNNSGSGQ